MKVNVKRLTDTAIIPTQGSTGAAGYDLYADSCKDRTPENGTCMLMPNSCVTIGTGIAMEIPKGYVGLVYVRSGLGIKKGLIPRNAVGVIDSDYRGEIMVCLLNTSSEWVDIELGDRIAQIVVTPYLEMEFTEVDELDTTERGEGGFGSTGKA